MSFKDKSIEIIDWTGKVLFIGDYDSPLVDEVLKANRCECYENEPTDKNGTDADCKKCDDTGYSGDFEVNWVNESDKNNHSVYDYINY